MLTLEKINLDKNPKVQYNTYSISEEYK